MKNTNILYQHGTLALLVPGLLKGTLTMGELLKHGDTGIGTGEGLDGELVILDGVPYQVLGTGEVRIMKNEATIPFGNIHWADFKPAGEIKEMALPKLEEYILKNHSANSFFSVKIKGHFSGVTTRAVIKSNPPYKTLAQTASDQRIFERDTVEGTLLGYFAPALFAGAAVGGFHWHFLAADHNFGGHVLSIDGINGQLTFQDLSSLDLHLPTDDADFMNHDFNKESDILKVISEAE
jgi:acetolactate decarboxylase